MLPLSGAVALGEQAAANMGVRTIAPGKVDQNPPHFTGALHRCTAATELESLGFATIGGLEVQEQR